jgi:hypothetical protein
LINCNPFHKANESWFDKNKRRRYERHTIRYN